MPDSQTPTRRSTRTPEGPDGPSPLARAVTILLIVASLATIFGFAPLAGRALTLPDKTTMTIIGLGVIAGLVHLFGVIPAQRQLRAFVSPVVAWPVMLAGIVTLLTS